MSFQGARAVQGGPSPLRQTSPRLHIEVVLYILTQQKVVAGVMVHLVKQRHKYPHLPIVQSDLLFQLGGAPRGRKSALPSIIP